MKILIGITMAVILFHFLILLKIIPYDITWGGRLNTDQEMYVFSGFSIVVNSFFIYILMQKAQYVKVVLSEKALTFILWTFFSIFVLNTIGNLIAKTNFEKFFTILTFINALLVWQINKSNKLRTNRE